MTPLQVVGITASTIGLIFSVMLLSIKGCRKLAAVLLAISIFSLYINAM